MKNRKRKVLDECPNTLYDEEDNEQLTQLKEGRCLIGSVNVRSNHVDYYPAQLIDLCRNVEDLTFQSLRTRNPLSGPNFVFQGDNKEILSTLLVQRFRGKVDLIYIDPPFASGADYVRKVALRGKKEKLEAEGYSVTETETIH